MKKILLIEDEAALQETIGHALKENGYAVISAINGEIGFKLAKKELPALIILDLILPKLNGFEVLAKLKQDPLTKDIQVIVLSNLERVEDVSKVLSLGVKNYLVKANYTIGEIISKVKEIIGE